jgi:hypothetical protein
MLLFGLVGITAAQYCSSGPTSPLDSNLGLVFLRGNSNNINNADDCPGSVGVQDFTNEEANLSPGKSYTLSYDVTTCNGQYNRYSSAWIDFNADGQFTADEEIGTATLTSQSPDTQNKEFTVPDDAVLGVTEMRVMVQERASAGMGPCDMFGYGGTKQFSIRIGGGGGGSSGGMSGGSEFLLIVFLLGFVYFVGGFGYSYQVKGLRGSEAVCMQS